MERLSYAEINLKNYADNFRAMEKLVGPKVKIMAVVKANGYGHGAVGIAKEAEKLKAAYLGVACLYEAKQLRENDIKLPILVFGYWDNESLGEAVDLNLTVNVRAKETVKVLDRLAKRKNSVAKIHVEVDSGMHRSGIAPREALDLIRQIQKYPRVSVEGAFTHFASADEKDLAFARKQSRVFQELVNQLKKEKICPPLVHAANSAAALRLKDSRFNLIRPGIILYGLKPSADFKLPFRPKPAMSFKTKISQIIKIKAGETVGYGRTFKAKKETLAGVIPVGYADGFRRAPANWGFCLVRGRRVPLIGRVSMDQATVDVSGVKRVKIGDEAVLLGKQGKEEITAEEIAERIGTINYEVVSGIAGRVTRKFIR